MKLSYAAVGLAGLVMAGPAYAGLLPGDAIYSSFVTNTPDAGGNNYFLVGPPSSKLGGSPLAQEFNISAPAVLDAVTLRLSDSTPNDGGSIMVFLVPDPSGATLPPNNGSLQLTGAIDLGTILDKNLPVNGINGCVFGGASATINSCNTTISVNAPLTVTGDYWIALVDGADTNNGGTNPDSSGALWWRSGDNMAYDASGVNDNTLWNSHVNTAHTMVDQNGTYPTNTFEMQVDVVPEPSGIAMLAAGLTGLGFLRRRWGKRRAG